MAYPRRSISAAQHTATDQPTASLAAATAAETVKGSGIDGSQPLAPHPGMSQASQGGAMGVPVDVSDVMRNPVYNKEYMESIKPVHVPPKEVRPAGGNVSWVCYRCNMYVCMYVAGWQGNNGSLHSNWAVEASPSGF